MIVNGTFFTRLFDENDEEFEVSEEEMAKAFIVDGKVLKNNLMNSMSSFEVEFAEDKESWLITCKKGQVRKVAYWNLAVRA